MERKRKRRREKTVVSSSKALTRLSSLYNPYSKVDVACKKIIINAQAAVLLIILANQAQTVTDNGMNKDTVLLTTNLLITT